MHISNRPIVHIFCIYNVLRFCAEAKVTDEEYDLMPKLFHLDDFDTCMLSNNALYCSVVVQLSPLDPRNHSITWNIMQDVITDKRNYRHDLLRHGICVAKSCPNIAVGVDDQENLRSKISGCYTTKYESSGLRADVIDMHCETDQEFYPIDNYDLAVVIALGIIIWIVTFSTFYEGLARYRPKEEYDEIISTRSGRIISCFSLRRNWSRLRSDGKSEDEALQGIQGIRFYNTQLVIMAHVGMVAFAGPVQNPTFTENITRRSVNMLYVNGYCVIHTFMLITGFLISHNFLLLFEKCQKFQLRYIILAVVNRYIRLTPCLIVMMGINATWLNRFGNGPMWNKLVGAEYRNCRRNWWANLLFINNYYDVENMCMQHTWYLAMDSQLFMVALVVVAFMWKYQKLIGWILGASVAVGVTMPSIVNYYNDYDSVIRVYPEALYNLFLDSPQWHATYSSALTNFGAYALGLTFGYIFYSRKNQKVLTRKIYVAIWWILIWGLPLGVIYYGILIYKDDYEHDRLGAAIYASLQKNLFALGICLFVYGLTERVGWFLRDCVIWSPLQVLGRLTYCAYLVHAVIIRIRGGMARSPLYLSYYNLFALTIGDSAMSYIFATILALFVELPVSALQKLMVPQVAKR